MPIGIEVERYLERVVREWEVGCDRDVRAFASDLEQWLRRAIAEMPRGDWRRDWQRFVAAWRGRGVDVDDARELLAFLQNHERAVLAAAPPWTVGPLLAAAVPPKKPPITPLSQKPPKSSVNKGKTAPIADENQPKKPIPEKVKPTRPANKPDQKASGGEAPKPAADATKETPSTRMHLPSDARGKWIKGTKGNGVFEFFDNLENRNAGVAGIRVRFVNGNIARGAFPPSAYYGGSARTATVEIAKVTGSKPDNIAADEAMRKKLNNAEWERPRGYRWNHAGEPGSKTMELVDKDIHRVVHHQGPASEPRAALRAARAQRATGRAIVVLDVYSTLRSAFQASGVLKQDYEVASEAIYYFVADDKSVFIVEMPPPLIFGVGELIFNAKLKFIAGPRAGETQIITSEDVARYRAHIEKRWGKFVPGSLIAPPRFIPGTDRKTLPRVDQDGATIGYIDEDGPHEVPFGKRKF